MFIKARQAVQKFNTKLASRVKTKISKACKKVLNCKMLSCGKGQGEKATRDNLNKWALVALAAMDAKARSALENEVKTAHGNMTQLKD